MAKMLETLYSEQLKRNEEKSYLGYLATDGIRSEEGYYDSIRKAQTEKNLSDTNYGHRASKLSSIGLSGSGYEDYLRASAEKIYKNSYKNAQREFAVNEYKNLSGYQKYLSDYEALQNKISQSVIESIAKGSDFNFENAYAKAVNAGVSKDLAFQTASAGVRKAQNATIEKAITFAKINSLSPTQAKKYAESLGLEEFYAKQVYDAISTFTKEEKDYYSSMSADGYYNYIMSQSKIN